MSPTFEFDRYVNGRLMAEGVTIERQPTLERAMEAAAKIASRGPRGEKPVLVYRPDFDRVKQLEEEIEELDFLLNEGDALGKAERRATVLEKALSELLAANDAVQEVLCDGPDVPDFDPLALGKAQQRVTQAEVRARALLNGGSNERA